MKIVVHYTDKTYSEIYRIEAVDNLDENKLCQKIAEFNAKGDARAEMKEIDDNIGNFLLGRNGYKFLQECNDCAEDIVNTAKELDIPFYDIKEYISDVESLLERIEDKMKEFEKLIKERKEGI